jgi:glycosyltransferase involved in cell wall biosynthesis
MNVVLICNEYPPEPHGGIGTFVQILARSLVARGHVVSVVGLARRSEMRDDRGVRVVTLAERFKRDRLGPIFNRLALLHVVAREVARIGAHIVETPEFSGPMPFRLRKSPVVVRTHLSSTTFNRQLGYPPPRIYEWCERQTLAKHRNWIFVSRHAKELTSQTFGLEPKRSAVVHYPVSADESAAPPPLPSRFVLFGGTVSRRKGAVALAAAANLFLRQHESVDLVFAGRIESQTDAEIRQMIGSSLAPRVHFLGPLSRGAFLECVRRCEVFAFPSTLETFGLVVAEAMLCGKAVVSSDVPPFTEFVTNEQTGLLVQPTNPDAIAEAVGRLLGDAALRDHLGLAGAAFIRENYSVDRAVDETLAFYQQVLDSESQ